MSVETESEVANVAQVLKMMTGTNLNTKQLQQVVDKTMYEVDVHGDGKIGFKEFCHAVESMDSFKRITFNT